VSDLDIIRDEDPTDEISWVTSWNDLTERWGQAEEFAVRMEGLEVPGFPPAYTPSEFATRKAPPWLVPNIVPSGLSALFGPTNSGKTFVALDASLSLATGSGWAGQVTTQTNVMYFLAEGQGLASKRIEAWCEARGKSLSDLTGSFWIVPQRLPLSGVVPDGVNMAVAAKRLGVGLIVLDTWARTLEGDENDNTDVSRTVNLITDIRANSGVSVWVIHHTGHSADGRMRGASAFAAAIDCEIRVEGHMQDPGQPHVELSCTKQRDAAYFEPFLLEVVEAGESITFAPEPRTLSAADAVPVTDPRTASLADLVQLLQLGPRHSADLRGVAGLSATKLNSLLRELIEAGKVERVGNKYRLTGKVD